MNRERFYQNENFALIVGAQVLVIFTLANIVLVRGSLSGLPPYVAGPLLSFNVLLWFWPQMKDRPWLGMHSYLALQSLFVFLLFTQELIFAYLFFILCAQTMLMLPMRSCMIWILLFVSVTLWGNFYLHPEGGVLSAPVRAVMLIALFFFTSLVANVISRARRSQEQVTRLLTELSDAYLRLQDYTEKVESLAVAEERNRLSRELHDSIGHRLTTSIVQLEGALRLIGRQEPQRVTEMIETVRGQLIEGLRELRHTLDELRAPKIADSNLLRALQQLADEFSAATNTTLHTQLADVMPLLQSDIQRTTIYRTAQEALTNTQKHAQAQNIWLTLDATVNALILTVCNDGRDFVPLPNSQGYGLKGMRERAAQLGGTLHVTKPERGGTLLTLILPLQARKAK